MKKKVKKEKNSQRLLTGVIAVLLVLELFFGRGWGMETVQGMAGPASESESAETDLSPQRDQSGKKFRLAFLDYDEYLPASRQFFYILKGLEKHGWISEGSLPFTIEDIDSAEMSTKDMVEQLQKTDLGEYLEFSEGGFWYLGYDDPAEVADTLKKEAGPDIDLLIAFGTMPGLFAKELELPVPMVDFSATDPVASGIIDSAQDSGNPLIWAQVEPSLPQRQLKYYYSVYPFQRLGVIVYGDENVSGVPGIEQSARENGFSVVKHSIDMQPRNTAEEEDRYYSIVKSEISELLTEDIDAFFLTVDLINDTDRLKELLAPFYEKNIPVFLMDDVEAVKDGGFMLICANEIKGAGQFVADAIAKILNGAPAGSLPCVYSSAPTIYLNYSIGKKIGFPMSFALLSSCDEIFTEDEM